jgi:hypothetical protein
VSLSCGDEGYMAQLVFECNREMTGFSKFAKISANYLFLCDIYMRFLA